MHERFEGSETARPEHDFESRTGVLHSESGNRTLKYQLQLGVVLCGHCTLNILC